MMTISSPLCGLGAALALIVGLAPSGLGDCEPTWLPGTGPVGIVGKAYATTNWDPDGPGPQPPLLIVGGDISEAGGLPVSNIAAWNGVAWGALGAGLPAEVRALSAYHGELITAAGDEGLFAWNGQYWRPIGQAPGVYALAVYDDALIAAGQFTLIDGVVATNIARWDGNTWQPLGAGLSNGPVYALTSFGGDLIAAGEFQGTDGLAARRVARWDGTAWHSYLPVRSSVRAVTVYKNELVIAGDFTLAGTTAVSHVARLVGTNWVPVGTGVNGSVNALLVYGQDLMAAGEFTIAGGVPAGRIARWNGNTWQPLAEGATGDYPAVRALALYRNSLIAIGEFTQAGSEQVGNVASWNGTRWQALGLGLSSYGGLMHNGQAYAFAEFHNELYATGDFSYAGGVAASGIACLRPTGWQALGAGLHGAGLCVAADAEALYVGGSFDTAGGVLTNHVARWDGTEWMALDGGVTNTLGAAAVRALVTYDDQLVVAGRFDAAGGAPALSVAGWDGWTWQPFGNGLYGEVRALAVFNGDLIAGGSAALAGPDPQQLGAARWDGFHEWHPIGSDGLYGDVMALTVHDGALIAGGLLSTGNGPLAVARWDGGTWQRIGTNLWGTASTLLSMDDKLFAAEQLSVGSTSCSLARWDGTAWEPIPSLDDNVSGLAAIDGQLLVGGDFDSVGGFPAAGWAHWGCPPAAPTLCAGDMNCDGAVNMSDIDPFVAALRGPDAWSIDATYSGCPWLNGDCNADSNVTFADIDAFVARLGSACDSLRAHRQGAILPNVRP